MVDGFSYKGSLSNLFIKQGMMTLARGSVAFLHSSDVGIERPLLWWNGNTDRHAPRALVEMRSISQAQGALQELAKLLPDTAILLTDDESTQEVLVEQLQEGDLILIRPGASIPADGMVQSGKSSVNEAMITGESKPVEKKQGERVLAGTVNGEGSLRVVELVTKQPSPELCG